ncbi:MAG TPA: hypothetical protein VGM56_22945 [Byssovorax sp.]|jgi:chromosome segregation ATPase
MSSSAAPGPQRRRKNSPRVEVADAEAEGAAPAVVEAEPTVDITAALDAATDVAQQALAEESEGGGVVTAEVETAAPPVATEAEQIAADKKRIHDQLEALKRRESELRRELAIADHPALRGALRTIERGAAGVAAVDARIAEGLSKAEERKREVLDKRHEAAVARRDEVKTKIEELGAKLGELEAKVVELDAERAALGEVRTTALELERRSALTVLAAALVEHGPAIAAVGLDLPALVPALDGYRADILSLTDGAPAS